MSEKVLVNVDQDGVLWCTINRPEKRNAVDYDVINGLKQAINKANTEDDIKILVITGQGTESFCSGGDLSVFHNLHTKTDSFEMLSSMGEVLYGLACCLKPTVALLNGTAVGGGCEIATSCDFRIASDHINIGFIQADLAITTGWGAGAILLERLSLPNALEMLMKGKRYRADEAKRLGFIQYVYKESTFMEQFNDWLKQFKNKDVEVLKAYKQIVNRKLNEKQLKRNMMEEIEKCAELWEAESHHLAVQSFLTKKK